MEENFNWFDEEIAKLEKNNWLYKFACFLLFLNKRKMTYKEMYMLLSRLNEKNLGLEMSKKKSMNSILNTYKYNNNKFPDGIREND